MPHLRLVFADGTPVCPGAHGFGRPWHPGASPDEPGACTHTFTKAPAVPLDVHLQVVYDVYWNHGQGGRGETIESNDTSDPRVAPVGVREVEVVGIDWIPG